jgi:hypothetical protein
MLRATCLISGVRVANLLHRTDAETLDMRGAEENGCLTKGSKTDAMHHSQLLFATTVLRAFCASPLTVSPTASFRLSDTIRLVVRVNFS